MITKGGSGEEFRCKCGHPLANHEEGRGAHMAGAYENSPCRECECADFEDTWEGFTGTYYADTEAGRAMLIARQPEAKVVVCQTTS
jgi:hypothetical protein